MITQILFTLLKFVGFLLIFYLSFYPIGLLIVKFIKVKLYSWERITLSFAASINLFVLLAFILGFLNLRFLMIYLVIISNLISIYFLKTEIFRDWISLIKSKFLTMLLFVGILVQGFINFPSGYFYNQGLLFWSSQGNDGLWHVAVMEEIKKTLPALNPIFSGEKLYNYHYLVDVLMGEFGRIYSWFSSLDLYFRFFPVVFSFFIGISVFSLLYRLYSKREIGYLAIFFTYLSGSFGYIVTFIKSHQLFGGETIFWAAQGNTIIGNPPHAISYFLLTTFFLILAIFFSTKTKNLLPIALVIGSMLVGFKVSAGVVLLAGICSTVFFQIIFKRSFSLVYVAIFLVISNAIVLFLLSRGAGSFLIFQPWWFIRTTIVSSDRVGWIDLELRRQFYLSLGTWNAYLRVLEFEIIAFLIFLVGNLGTRVVGFLFLVRELYKNKLRFFEKPVETGLFISMITAFVIPLLFVQKGIAYNSIQFMQYFILIFGFFAAVSTYWILIKIKNRILKYIFIIFVVALSVPTVIGNFREFYSRSALAIIDNSEITALNYLKANSSETSIILTTPFDGNAHYGYKSQPWPISVWYSTAYVSAISSRQTYLSNEDQVDILGYPLKGRLAEVKKFFSQSDSSWDMDFLTKNRISYIYIRKSDISVPISTAKDSLSVFYENSEVVIYKLKGV